MRDFRKVTFVLLVVSALVAHAQRGPVASDPGRADTDRTVRPGDDFYGYANNAWLRTVTDAAGQDGYDTRAMLRERTSQRVRDLIQEAASNRPGAGTTAQKVGDYYAAFIDTSAIESKGLSPLDTEMAAIAAIADTTSLSAYLGTTLNSEVDGLTANADHVFGAWVNQAFDDSTRCVLHLVQGGLGLPDRDHYLDHSPKMDALRQAYRAHIAAMLRLAGVPAPDDAAARAWLLETRIAEAHAPGADAADVFKQNNPWARAEFDARAPGMDWRAYFTAAGVDGQPRFIVWQPSAVAGVSALVKSAGIDAWKAYLTFHLIEHYAGVLPRAVATEHFAFHGAALSGLAQVPDRSISAIAATNAALGQAVGQLYVRRHFPAGAKAQAQGMVANLIAAYRARISRLGWMSPATKAQALTKLAALRVDVGYPDTWIDYATLDIVRGDAFGNMRRAEAFNRARNLGMLRRPADPGEWRIDPQMVAAVILFSPNTETFSAGLLQPPFFDAEGDAASNYGSAGAGIAHEITHSFDELGNIYDDQGRLRRWWTADDLARYRAASATLSAQLDALCPRPGLCVKGSQVLSESIADLAGVQVAHDAYLMSLNGKADVVIGGLTGEQRFFVAFARRWRKSQGDAALRRQLATDTHLLPEYRSNLVRNVDAWYAAFGVAPGDRLALSPTARVSIW